MNAPLRNAQPYSPARFWFSLFSAAILVPSAYWLASIALSEIRQRWFVIFSGCMFFVVVGLVIALIRRAINERRKRLGWQQ